jgi:hypothetical protein
LNSRNYTSIYDLHLILYRGIKDDLDTKISSYVTLSQLQSLGLLKSYRYPFFIFKDNRNSNNQIALEITNTHEQLENPYQIYKNYVSRVSFLKMLRDFPEIEDFNNSSKRGVNDLNRFMIDPLISENSSLDWFIYDDESLNFLMNIEQLEDEIEQEIFFCEGSGENKLFFQDKLKNLSLDLCQKGSNHKFYLNLNLDSGVKIIGI